MKRFAWILVLGLALVAFPALAQQPEVEVDSTVSAILSFLAPVLLILAGVFGILLKTNNDAANKVGLIGLQITKAIEDAVDPTTHGGAGGTFDKPLGKSKS